MTFEEYKGSERNWGTFLSRQTSDVSMGWRR